MTRRTYLLTGSLRNCGLLHLSVTLELSDSSLRIGKSLASIPLAKNKESYFLFWTELSLKLTWKKNSGTPLRDIGTTMLVHFLDKRLDAFYLPCRWDWDISKRSITKRRLGSSCGYRMMGITKQKFWNEHFMSINSFSYYSLFPGHTPVSASIPLDSLIRTPHRAT